ncbi:LysR family transcriptional regulator [Hydrogenophaga sp.]|jgi:DNA-binding transcriptional LysR family regulator|uniref:LysR family transcriptional regulator n=1 Tax=Hydrogenophaga sp. TaxID=1904254 RepID=UPI003F6F7D67
MSPPPRSEWFVQSRLKLRQLLLVTTLGELGNLHKSASRLAMTQPTATKLLQELEGTLGVTLFERSKRGMAPTVYGLALIRHARGLLADLDAAREEIQALVHGATGTLAIGAMASTASVVLPRAVASLTARHPNLQISIVEGTHAMLVTTLKAGGLDLMLGRVMGGSEMDDLQHQVMYRDDFCIVSGPDHPLARSRKLTLKALVNERWVLPPSSAPLRQSLDILFMSQAESRPRHAVESVSLLTNLRMIQEGHMLGVMPADIARHFARSKLLSILPVPLNDLFGPVALITRRGRALSPAAQAFVEELQKSSTGKGLPRSSRD